MTWHPLRNCQGWQQFRWGDPLPKRGPGPTTKTRWKTEFIKAARTSEEAIAQARRAAEIALGEQAKTAHFSIEFEVRSATEALPLKDASVDVVLDMMTNHFLKSKERANLLKEILRVLKPYGWMFMKTFILEGDQNAIRMINESPAGEENSYIHPEIGVYEYVATEDTLRKFFSPHFKIHKLIKSHKHVKDGKAWKRRTVSLYLEKLPAM